MAHDGYGEHYHDLGERVSANDDTVVWTTVGLDIGSSTSQALFSRITLAREDAYYVVAERTVLHQSDVILTPYASPELIDQKQLAAFVEREFAAAKLSRADIDTGAVIMTGLALATDNARIIADVVADDSGRFVAVSAGDMLEARLAANGAGVPALSNATHGNLVHIDVGGGTTKLSLWNAGKLQRLAAVDVGARIVKLDPAGNVLRLEPPAVRMIEALQLDIRVGEPLRPELAELLCRELVRNVLSFAGLLKQPATCPWLLRTTALLAPETLRRIDAVVFSGGVSEYIYGRESRQFGDLGAVLGRILREAAAATGAELLISEQGIRATVLGASQHSVQLSGNTIYVSQPAALPLRNLPVLIPHQSLAAQKLDQTRLTRSFRDTLALYSESATPGLRAPALAIRWEGSALYERIAAVANAVTDAMEPYLAQGAPLVLVVDGDVAGLLGSHLHKLVGERNAVVCLDGIHVHEFDHMDIGEFGAGSRALPVVVKSLLFSDALEKTDHHHVHH